MTVWQFHGSENETSSLDPSAKVNCRNDLNQVWAPSEMPLETSDSRCGCRAFEFSTNDSMTMLSSDFQESVMGTYYLNSYDSVGYHLYNDLNPSSRYLHYYAPDGVNIKFRAHYSSSCENNKLLIQLTFLRIG